MHIGEQVFWPLPCASSKRGAKTMLNKLAATKTAIVLLMESQAPCSMHDILTEVEQQAYPSKLPEALYELQQGGFMVWSESDRAFSLA